MIVWISSYAYRHSEKSILDEIHSLLVLQQAIKGGRGYSGAKSPGCHGCAPNKAVA
jgi:hypothetical protein